MQIAPVKFTPPPSLLTAEESRFLLFMTTTEPPFTEDKIYAWYRKYVSLPDSFWARQLWLEENGKSDGYWKSGTAESVLREYALKWFDRWLGKCMRTGRSFRKEDYTLRIDEGRWSRVEVVAPPSLT